MLERDIQKKANRFLSAGPTARRMAVFAGLLAGASALEAQQGDPAAVDSLAARLRRAEATLAMLEQQIAEQARTAARARDGAGVQLYGRVVSNAFTNDRRVNNVDNPQFVGPSPATPAGEGGFGMAIRQTMLGLAVTVPEVGSARFSGDVDVDFYGGQQPSGGGRTFPLLRMRTARAILRWESTELLVGQEAPLIAGLNPVSPAALGSPGFAAAGNLWLWLPQVRATVERGRRVRVALQGAVLAPASGDPMAPFDTDFDLAERSRRPFLQARVAARGGSDESRWDAGCGLHQGWIVPGGTRDSQVGSSAVACDALVPLTEWLELRAEMYRGEALRGLGGGGVGQGIAPTGRAVRDRGGWAQVNLRPAFDWRTGAGCGMSDPDDRDVPANGRLGNSACAVYANVTPLGGPVFVGAEARRLRTTYVGGARTNHHLNLALGFTF